MINNLTRSISFRLTVIFATTLSVCLLIAFIVTYFQVSFSLEKSSRAVISAKWREMSTVLEKSNVSGLQEFLESPLQSGRNALFLIRVVSGQGKTLFLKPSVQEEIFDFQKLFESSIYQSWRIGWSELQAPNDEDKFDILTDKVGRELILQVGTSSADRDDVLEKMSLNFGLAMAAFILVGVLLGTFYARSALAPVRNLSLAIQSIERGDLTQRVSVSGTQNELRDLGETFNRMINRIEELVKAMHESLDDLAHDIRTPLTRIRNVAESAIVTNDGVRALSALADCAENVGEISGLVDQLLDLSEAKAGVLKLRIEPTNIFELLSQVIDLYQFVAEEKQITLNLTVDRSLEWRLDRNRIKRALANLVDNALKFSPPDSSVDVVASKQGDDLICEVIDSGAGVANEDLPRIWDRLYRGDKSRSETGMGLGLAIVRAMVRAHRGAATAQNRVDRSGTIFRLAIPNQDLPTRSTLC